MTFQFLSDVVFQFLKGRLLLGLTDFNGVTLVIISAIMSSVGQ